MAGQEWTPADVENGLRVILDAFETFLSRFNEITRRAPGQFEAGNWSGCEKDAVERLDVYPDTVRRAIDRLREQLGDRVDQRELWRSIKEAYADAVLRTRNRELAETYFNSISRRIFATEGVRPDIEFASPSSDDAPRDASPDLLARFSGTGGTAKWVRRILEEFRFRVDYRNLEQDATLAAHRIDELLRPLGSPPVDEIEILRPVFFRVKHAYLIGRIHAGEYQLPLVLALLRDDQGVFVDAVLMDEDDTSVLFSFTRAYFHVETECPAELVHFIRSILPLKPIAELYLAIGFHKHGKTELFRSLQRHLEISSDVFDLAEGDRGMVMLVFTLPSYDTVFKVIRDRFDAPKDTTARDVQRRYRIVFERDRVGRLVEAQEFEHLLFPRERFSPRLLEELTAEAANTVRINESHVVFDHLYTERKVLPLNLFLRDCSKEEALQAVLDYGSAIEELAAANIFPGDFLLKNFGVTRHGRVVFYDYDELCLLTDCNFRRIPPARHPEDEMAQEPWFTVGPNDIFPEEFRRFLGLSPTLLQQLDRHHGALFTAEFWQGLQQRHRDGEILDFYPYPERKRLRGLS